MGRNFQMRVRFRFKNLGGRPLDALFGPCQHLSNLDLMIKRKIQIFVSEIGTLRLKGIWVELLGSIIKFRQKRNLRERKNNGACKRCKFSSDASWRDCVTGGRYEIGRIWQELDLSWACIRASPTPTDNGTVWQILETGKIDLRHAFSEKLNSFESF